MKKLLLNKIIKFCVSMVVLLIPLAIEAQNCTFDQQSRNGHDEVNKILFDYLTIQHDHSNARMASICPPSSDTLKIPVVVHLVYASTTPSKTKANLTDSIVKGLIGDWNLRFSKLTGRTYTNPYSGVETMIRFVLATRDPQGNATNGIMHHQDNTLASGINQANDTLMKKKYGWNSLNYYNFYVVDTFAQAGLAGYAMFPSAHGTINDGAVFQGSYVWKGFYYNTGLMAHETGHYLGLYHSFTDAGTCTNNNCMLDGDQVCDTPPKNIAGQTGTSCINPGNSCSTDTDDIDPRNPFRAINLGGLGDQPDGNELYMDYTGGCWGLNYKTSYTQTGAFTQGQKDRMRASILTIRKSLLVSPALVPLNAQEISVNSIVSPTNVACANAVPVTFNVSNLGTSNITSFSYTINVNGTAAITQTWNGTLTPNTSTNVISLAITLSNGQNSIQVIATLNGDNYSKNNSICANVILNPSITSASFVNNLETPLTGWNVVNPDGLAEFSPLSLTTCNVNGNNSLGYICQATQVASNGTNDYLESDVIDLKNFTAASFSFNYAHKGYYSNRQLNLNVEVSTDCGLNYTSLWGYGTGTGLATVTSGGVYTAYTPSSCSDWKSVNIPLTNYLGKAIKIRFNAKVVSYGAQNLYLDNISMTGTKSVTGIEDYNSSPFSISPNPLLNGFTIRATNNENVSLTVTDISGAIVFEGVVETNKELSVLNGVANGVYIAKIKNADSQQVIKLLK